MPASELPDIELSEEQRTAITTWLNDELHNAHTERQELIDHWEEIQEIYEKTTFDSKKDYPFEGAAYLSIPVMPTFVEQICAKIQNTIWAPEDPFTPKPTRRELVEYSKSIRRWLTWSVTEELELPEITDSMFLELCKLGSCVAKVVYTTEDRTIREWIGEKEDGEWQEIVETVKDYPEILHIPLNDFLFRAHVRKLEEAEWVGHRFRLTWNEILRRVARGDYDKEQVEKIAEVKSRRSDLDQTTDELAAQEPVTFDEYEFVEVWFEYSLNKESDLDSVNDDLPTSLVAVYHPDTQTILRIQYNWFPLQLTPFELCPYVPREHNVLGIGVGTMSLPFHKEISTMHNQRLDNATIANATAYKYKADSMLGTTIRLRPGLGLPVEDMDDIQPLQLGQKYDSTIAEEQHTLQFLQQRIGINEITDLQTQANTPATTTLAMMQERGRRFDNVIRNVRKFLGRLMVKVILLYQAYYPRERLIELLGEDGMAVVALLEGLTPHMLYDGIGIQVTATTSSQSKELERQAKLSLFNLLTNYYAQLTQYLATASNPQFPPEAREALMEVITGLSSFVGEVLEDFNIRNRDEFVIQLGRAQAAAQQAAGAAAAGGQGAPGMGAGAAGAGQAGPPQGASPAQQ